MGMGALADEAFERLRWRVDVAQYRQDDKTADSVDHLGYAFDAADDIAPRDPAALAAVVKEILESGEPHVTAVVRRAIVETLHETVVARYHEAAEVS